MFFEYMTNDNYTRVTAEIDDLCVMCRNFDTCPLIGAIENNAVYPASSKIYVEECSTYEPISIEELN